MSLDFNVTSEQELRRDWLRLLAWIKAKRTHRPAFKVLMDKILEDHNHPNYHQALTIKMFYDFTPVEEITPPTSESQAPD